MSKPSIEDIKKVCKDLSVLYVEDDKKIRELMQKYLLKLCGRVDFAVDGSEGLRKFEQNRYDMVLSDIVMPKLDGLGMAKKIKEINKYQKIIIVSAYSNTSEFLESIRIGVDGYILKPFEYGQINEALYKVATIILEEKENERYKNTLLQMVEEKTKEVLRLEVQKTKNYKDALYTLVDLIEKRDTYTGGHSSRVAEYSKKIAQEMGLNSSSIDTLYEAAILHDIGKIAIPDSILLKPGDLNDLEYDLIKQHVNMGYDVLKKYNIFKDIAHIIKIHHERIDGSGYPEGLKGDEISLEGKILAVADSFDAMTTSRIYKPRKSVKDALEEFEKLSGVKFDKEVVKAARRVLSDIKISNKITQKPMTDMEKERFAYFYKDQLTNLYNQNYLDVILSSNVYNKSYDTAQVLLLRNFGSFNKKNGWIKGDDYLKSIAYMLVKEFPQSLSFRISGDDFVILGHNKNLPEDIIKKYQDENVKIVFISVDLLKENILSFDDLERYLLTKYD